MRHILTLAACLLLCAGLGAQEEHLRFNGIPLDGPVEAFTVALEGFTVLGSNDAGIILQGTLYGRSCKLLVKSLPGSGIVYGVDASLPIRNDWSVCKGDYLALQKELSAIYGRPKKIEKFDHPFREGDRCELRHLNMGLCKWLSDYMTPEGSVSLRIQPVIVNNGQVVVSFEDRQNAALLN